MAVTSTAMTSKARRAATASSSHWRIRVRNAAGTRASMDTPAD